MPVKKIKIPLIGQFVYYYYGDDYIQRFEKHIGEKLNPGDISAYGFVNGNALAFKPGVVSLSTLFHEVSHVVDNMIEHIGAHGEAEMRANITGYLGRELTKTMVSMGVLDL